MSQKTQKPTLTGQRIKTRKRDEKEKYDPTNFRDQIVAGLNEANLDLEQASKFLIQAGSKLDFRRYAEALFDILITGGILAPGGTIVTDNNAAISKLCIFNTEGDLEQMRNVTQLFERMIRQYKYLEKSLDDEMKMVVMFMKGFTDIHRNRLTTAVFLFMSSGLISPNCLTQITNEHLVKDGISLDFAKIFFLTWLREKDFGSLLSVLKKAEIDGKLLELIPLNKRSIDTFENFFDDADLKPVIDFQRNQYTRNATKELKSKLKKLLGNEVSPQELISVTRECTEKHNLQNAEVCSILWSSLMKAVEWNKKEDLLAEQALRHLKKYVSVLATFASSPKIELILLQKIQEYCYDNMNFLKLFQKIVMLLYKTDVIAEDTIISWYKTGHGQKGKSVFLTQMEKMVVWLQNAEEESSDDDDDDDDDE